MAVRDAAGRVLTHWHSNSFLWIDDEHDYSLVLTHVAVVNLFIQSKQTCDAIICTEDESMIKIKNEWALTHGCHPIVWCYSWMDPCDLCMHLDLFWIWWLQKEWFVDSNESWHVRYILWVSIWSAPSFLCGIQKHPRRRIITRPNRTVSVYFLACSRHEIEMQWSEIKRFPRWYRLFW